MSGDFDCQPPAIRPFRGGVLKKVVITAAFLTFAYGVWQIIVQKKADRIAATVLILSFVVIFAISFAESLKHRRELRVWIQKQRELNQTAPERMSKKEPN
jgi:hypothetical protein